ncbi:SPOR domain-containing protein [Vibrio sp. LaRot3]|uniref:SPOR domain-containing protein n=1 Tax=Vibrio sp. LaRot3 TaxID=2998829 RepID=UPI0022CDF3FF|nr:AAA family ATPase [Vibrio sp. LaRot3]MDA0149457.1 AAA family ATPase [Vibrio sp. LaRot3]
MSVMHQSRMLEFDSQTELLERLQLLTHFNSNFITVGGVQGAGKTWLAQRYLEAWAEEKNQSLLMCHPNQDDEQRRTTILTQVLPEPLFNPADSLVESFTRCMESEMCDIVIVIDDGHLLSETFVSELWLLFMEAQQHSLWTINIVLFSQPNSLDALLTRLSYGQESKPVEFEIEPLSAQEAERFFEHLVMRFVEDDRERRVRNAYKSVARRPGLIMALGEQKMEKRIIIRSIVGSPIKIGIFVVALLMLIGGGYLWMMGQPTPDETAEQITQTVEQTVIPTIEEQAEPSSSAVSTLPTVDETPVVDPSFAQAEDDTDALPPEVVDAPVSVGVIEDDSQRVVINSEVVDALLEGKPEQVDTTQVDKAAAEAVVKTEVINEQPPQTPTTVKFSFAKDELNAFSPRSYTLQLAAVQSLVEAQNFLNKYQLSEEVYVYPTVRSGVEWFIITYKNYPTIQLARDGVAELSDELKKLDPWAKSLNQVQREIARGN